MSASHWGLGLYRAEVAATSFTSRYQFPGQTPGSRGVVIGEVMLAQGGEAQVVAFAEGSAKVDCHASSAPWLEEGDRVLVYLLEDQVVVGDRVVMNGERRPEQIEKWLPVTVGEDGEYRIDAPKKFVIQVGESRIELNERGRVRIEGKEVSGLAKGRMTLRGVTIDLN